MYEHTIEAILTKDMYTKKTFKDCLARDELPTKPEWPSCYVINTEPRHKPGQHWIALNFDTNGHAYFFCSYGMPPAYYKLEQYIKTNSSKYTFNQKRIQGNSNYCGFYCIFFLLFINRNDLKTFFDKFKTNLFENDNYIFNEINKNLKNKY